MGLSLFFKKKPILNPKEISFKNQIEDVIFELLPEMKSLYIQDKKTRIIGDINVKIKNFKDTKFYLIFQESLTKAFVENNFWLTYENVKDTFADLNITDKLTPSCEMINGVLYEKIELTINMLPLLKLMDNIRKLDNCLPYQNFNESLFDKVVKSEFTNCFRLSPREAGMSMAKGMAFAPDDDTTMENPWFREGKGAFIEIYASFKQLIKDNQTLDVKTALCSIMSLNKSYCPSRERLNSHLNNLQIALDGYKVASLPKMETENKKIKKSRRSLS